MVNEDDIVFLVVFMCVFYVCFEGGIESCFDNGENYDNNEQLYLYRVMHE